MEDRLLPREGGGERVHIVNRRRDERQIAPMHPHAREVERRDILARTDQRIHHMRPDEPARTRDQNVLHDSPTL